ncbi:MAG: hypothetical protein ACT4PZ_21015 [Panacagrimonas sp.]
MFGKFLRAIGLNRVQEPSVERALSIADRACASPVLNFFEQAVLQQSLNSVRSGDIAVLWTIGRFLETGRVPGAPLLGMQGESTDRKHLTDSVLAVWCLRHVADAGFHQLDFAKWLLRDDEFNQMFYSLEKKQPIVDLGSQALALTYLAKAAENDGYEGALAYEMLGEFTYAGYIGEVNYAASFEYFIKASEKKTGFFYQNSSNCLFWRRLARMTFDGLGTTKSRDGAFFWSCLGEKDELLDALFGLSHVRAAAEVDKQALEIAKSKARSWCLEHEPYFHAGF